MPAKDRLSELYASQKVKSQPVSEVSIPMLRKDSMARFLERVDEIQASIDVLSSKAEALKNIHQIILDSPAVNPADHDEQERVLQDITAITANIRTSMKILQKEADKEERKVQSFTTGRIKRNQCMALSRRLSNITSEYNREQTKHRQRLKDQLKRKLQIADSVRRTDDEIEKLLENENLMVFSQGIIQDTEQAKEALADVEARHQDILALERSVKEVTQLFQEVATYVELQSETLDRVEDNMKSAAVSADSAKKETAGALANQKRARKCKIIGLIILVVVILIVAISLAFQFG